MRHIGVAVIKQNPNLAIPLRTLPAKRGEIDHALLDTVVLEHRPDRCVVGLPLNMDGTTSTESRKAKRFGEHLAKRYRVEIDYVDERLTTREAVDRSNDPHPDHSVAALVIAEAWLSAQSEQ